MKLLSALYLFALTGTALAESITTVITATKNGHVYTKTVTQDATFVWAGEGSAATSTVTAAPISISSAETSSAVSSSAVSSAESSSANEGSGSSITTVITATKNGHVYTKTVTQDATFVWTGEGSAATSTVSPVAVSSAAVSSAEPSSANEGSGSSITTVITATKNGHVYTKTVTQDATFVWAGEGSAATSTVTAAPISISSAETSSAVSSSAVSSAESSSANEGSGSSITTVITATKNGHVYTKTVTQDATFVWTGEGSAATSTVTAAPISISSAETSSAVSSSAVSSAESSSANEGSGSSITTVITATKNGHVYTKTVTQDATFVWTGEGSAATSTVSPVAVSSAAVSSAEPSSANEGSGSSITTVITATKNGHVYTKTVTQDATFVWTGEGSAATSTVTAAPISISSAETSSAVSSSAVSSAESSSANEGSGSSITTVITATKNGHVYTKTVTQDATFVWTGEGSAATSTVSPVAVSSAAVSSAEPSSANEGSGSSITTVITATKNGHVYTKTVTQDATFVWTGEGSAATSTVTAAPISISSAETSSAVSSSAVSSAESSSANEGSGSSITTVITATKNGHVYTKTVTQDATFVWTGEGSAATSTVSPVAVSSAAVSSAEPSSANEGSGSSITTVITATKNGHVYTKTVTQDATFVWTGEGSAATSTVSPVAVSSAAVSSAEPSSANEGSGSSITTVITATKNGHVYTKTVTQDATFVWTGEGSAATSTVSPVAVSSAAVSSAEPSSANEGSGSSITTVITATKNGHVYTKTVTQDATFVWTGEGSAATSTVSPVAVSSAAVSSAEISSADVSSAEISSAVSFANVSSTISFENVSSAETSSANEGSGSSITTVITATKNGYVYTKTVTQDATCVGAGESSPATSAVSSAAAAATSGSSIATVITSTKNGHLYTEIVTQDASFVRTDEGSNIWAPSTSTSAGIVSKASATTVATSATAKSSTTAQIASYTGAADAVTAGTGLMGAALAVVIFL
ncbi:hypothetical protein SUVZ_08G0060 [Saccharomyces uvarum]|uniref:Uncharacterized protein n=1 Tax=Saccharomyces uvarum TaxID=230603 RepID=A0ABN8WZK5_SACUV|nr:hypothetical protein SUVZ_08G0060 [Saccharomyces uvarum]